MWIVLFLWRNRMDRRIVRATSGKRIELLGCRTDTAKMQLLYVNHAFKIQLILPNTIITVVPVAQDIGHAYKQFLLIEALPVLTEVLISTAAAMVFALSINAVLDDPNIDPDSVRQAVGEEETERILAVSVPEDLLDLVA
jgi:hypothetical protein